MTTFHYVEKTCAVCGTRFNTRVCRSYSTRGCMMDGRTIHIGGGPHHVTNCPECGYIAWNIEENIGVTKEELESKEYKDIKNVFCAAAYLLSLHGDIENAAWSYLHAAWAYDDNQRFFGHEDQKIDKEMSNEMRRKALQEFLKIEKPTPTIMLVISDILRNLGRFDEASEWVDKIEKSEGYEPHSLPLNHEKRLISERCDAPARAEWY